ncbi:MAG: TIR domain-containing protein [Nannocystis sp.]|nr:TIR domain-containing protein [Nannocystis sp.]
MSLKKVALATLTLYGLHRIFGAKDPQKTFFSFHYDNDIWRVNQIRNSWVTYGSPEKAGFFDHSLWETAKIRGDAAIRRIIDDALEDSEVTVVLIGEETWQSRWVQYEIKKSIERNNGLIGVYIDGLRDRSGQPSHRGFSPFDDFVIESGHPITDGSTLRLLGRRRLHQPPPLDRQRPANR